MERQGIKVKKLAAEYIKFWTHRLGSDSQIELTSDIIIMALDSKTFRQAIRRKNNKKQNFINKV